MRTNTILSSVLTASTLFTASLNARENVGMSSGKTTVPVDANKIAAACTPAQTRTTFELNNVRTIILTAGDMWWAAANNAPQYEIPKDGNAHSLFAGALWIGGIDGGGQLKVAAMTYRQSGNDFWPGTLDTVSVSTDDTRCNYYDKHFRITRKEVEDFIGWRNNPADFPGYQVPKSITDWPANPYFTNETRSLAPFHDEDFDGVYNHEAGDYPNYNVTNSTTCSNNFLFGDETLWWVFNDMGNIHTESNGQPIGLEIQAQAFAFQTNDEINNMTFYKYKISNRSSFSIDSTFFGQWVDSDLGGAKDDFVGCDVGRGLGYTYNGDNLDLDYNGSKGYGDELPAMGIDFFEGPFVNVGGIDLPKSVTNPASANGFGYGDGIPGNERAGMAKFVFYNNDNSVKGNPRSATDFYGYCSGSWRDGTRFTYGGSAKGGSQVCSFMYPGNSDPLGYGTGGNITGATWTELITYDGSTPATPDDRRFFQSAGPFRLLPGAVNYVTVGAVWARAPKGAAATAAIPLLQAADDKAQSLFDNCFKVLDGPDSPDLTIQELDKQLLVYITNKPTSNNYLEKYKERDPTISTATYTDTAYEFEGYQIYQLKDASVSAADLLNPDKARLVKQVDLKNNITQLVNFEFDASLNANVPTEMVDGENNGIVHSFSVTEDQFAQGNKTLVNHKQYYYMAVAYAENNFKQYDQNSSSSLDGQKKPYKAGRRNIKVYTGIPHIPSPEANGTVANSTYGYGPKLRRIEGQGNGGRELELTQETINKILSSPTHRDSLPEYENGKGPVDIRVIDPLNVPAADFTFYMLDSVTSSNLTDAYWMLKNNTSGEMVYSGRTIEVADEYIITKWGLSVTVNQVVQPGDSLTINNGYITSSITFGDPLTTWLTGVVDVDAYNTMNWIRSGVQSSTITGLSAFNDRSGIDDEGIYEKVVGGTWAPYVLSYASDAASSPNGYFSPGGVHSNSGTNSIKYLSSVDVVITSDRSKWTRCPVLEMSDESVFAIGAAPKHTYRRSPSVDKYGRKAGDAGTVSDGSENDPNFIDAQGMGWFPGYVINIETGERLNIAFGEDSGLPGENGSDMIWNPTSTLYPPTGGHTYFGGRHYLYIFNHIEDSKAQLYYDAGSNVPRYDYGRQLRKFLTATANASAKASMWRACIWTNIPVLSPGYSSLSQYGQNITIPTDVKVKLRVAKPYQRGFSTQFMLPIPHALVDTVKTADQNNDRPMYTFNTYDLQTVVSDADAALNALDLINIVPNPYYAYSAYEGSTGVSARIDNRVKITNLPEKCTIKIYTLNGTLIRKFDVDQPATARNTMGVPVTSQDWDLKNGAGIPISSGMYIIHIDVPGIDKDKVLKWFGVMRPIDLESY